jgi:hypothetical protein
MTADRGFSREGAGTRLDMTMESRIENRWRHPLAWLVNALWGNSSGTLELEHALHIAIDHLERQHVPREIRNDQTR